MNQRGNVEQKDLKQMTQEELQKTQVLNLQDVEEAVRYEKRTSKKPAIIVACIGAFALLFGGVLTFVQPMLIKEEKPKTTKKVEKKKVLNTESNLNCTLTNLNNQDGTDTILNVNLTFSYDKLTKVVKTYTINPTAGNPQGPTTVELYKTGYQPFLQTQIPGYQMTVTPASNGLIVTSTADLTVLDLNLLPELHRGNIATKVDYPVSTEKQTIQTDLTTKGFICG